MSLRILKFIVALFAIGGFGVFLATLDATFRHGTITPPLLTYAVIGGIIPSLIWLWFWLREDSLNPEPTRRLLYTFLAGMIIVPWVIPFQQLFTGGIHENPGVIIAWAGIEEIFKFAAAYFIILQHREADEPIDMVIYMITVALGFAAFENALFILNPLVNGEIIDTILTGNLRFFGATLLHVLCSALIGIALAFGFYRRRSIRRLYTFIGVILAIGLHAFFNFSIMQTQGGNALSTFAVVWIGIILLILVFEKVKRIKRLTSLSS